MNVSARLGFKEIMQKKKNNHWIIDPVSVLGFFVWGMHGALMKALRQRELSCDPTKVYSKANFK